MESISPRTTEGWGSGLLGVGRQNEKWQLYAPVSGIGDVCYACIGVKTHVVSARVPREHPLRTAAHRGQFVEMLLEALHGFACDFEQLRHLLRGGVRRLEAVAGASAFDSLRETNRVLEEAAAALKVSPAELPARIASLLEDRRRLERQLAEAQRKLATGGGESAVEQIGDVKLSARNLGDVPPRGSIHLFQRANSPSSRRCSVRRTR